MEIGQVLETKGNLLRLQMTREAACGSCHACTMGTESKAMELYALNLCDAKVNDMVEIHLETDSFLKAVATMYGIPLCGLLLGLFFGFAAAKYWQIAHYEMVAAMTGLAVMGLAFLGIRSQREKFKRKKYIPKAVRILEKGEW